MMTDAANHTTGSNNLSNPVAQSNKDTGRSKTHHSATVYAVVIEELSRQHLLSVSDKALLPADMPHGLLEPQDNKDDTPWFITLLLGVSGLLSGLSLIGFLYMLLDDILSGSLAQALVGAALLVLSFGLFKPSKKNTPTFLSSLAFTMSIAGQVFLVFAIVDAKLSTSVGVGVFMAIQSLLFLLIPDFLHRLVSGLIALGCLVWLVAHFGAPEAAPAILALIAAVFGLQRYQMLQYVAVPHRASVLQMSRALAYASAMLLLVVTLYFFRAGYDSPALMGASIVQQTGLFYYHYPLAQTLLLLAALYSAYLLMKRQGLALLSTDRKLALSVMAVISLFAILSIYVSGLLAAGIVCLIALANRQQVLLSLAIIALVGYIFWYYYQLDTTLLLKSISMLVVGLAILCIRWILIHKLHRTSEQGV